MGAGYLVLGDECPQEAQNEFEVAIDDIKGTCCKRRWNW